MTPSGGASPRPRPAASVTVVIPAFNREVSVERAVRSAQRQVLPPAEIIVVDDASTDGTADVARRLGARVLRHTTNRGAAAARNTAIAAATTRWIAFLDSDDEWLPRHLATLWAVREGYAFVACSALALHESGDVDRVLGPATWRPVRLTEPAQLVYPDNLVPASAALVDRRRLTAIGGFDTTVLFSEDFHLWTTLLRDGNGLVLPDVTALYHRHAEQKSGKRAAAGRSQHEIALRAAQNAPGLVDKREAVRLWDDARAGTGPSPVHLSWWMLRRPRRAAGVLGVLRWRWLVRRRGARLTVTGDARCVVVGRARLEPAADVKLERLARPTARNLVALVRRPPRYVAGCGLGAAGLAWVTGAIRLPVARKRSTAAGPRASERSSRPASAWPAGLRLGGAAASRRSRGPGR